MKLLEEFLWRYRFAFMLAFAIGWIIDGIRNGWSILNLVPAAWSALGFVMLFAVLELAKIVIKDPPE